ncbi:MAG: LCP family protein [Acidimicrobiales bacterium]
MIGLNLLIAVCLVGATTAYGYVRYRFGQIKRVDVGALIAPGTKNIAGQVADAPGSPLNIMVVGSDSRAVVSPAEQKAFGTTADSASQRSDTLMVVHLDPASNSASLISIPRDLWVPISDGRNFHNRINTAFETSPELLIKTVQDNLGIFINHFVEVDFNSFRNVVGALGGVKVWYPEPLRDTYSGLNITVPGCYPLNGNQALELVRARHVQYEENGRWRYEAESDLARIRRQQLFVKKVIAKAQNAGLTQVGAINGVIGGLVTNVTVDKNFTEKEMLRLAKRYASFSPDKLATFTLPVKEAVIPVSDGNADVLLPEPELDKAVLDAFQGVQPPPPAAPGAPAPAPQIQASSVKVGVLNGSGRAMEATNATNALRAQGFEAGIDGYGKADTFTNATSIIRYNPADETKAKFLESAVTGGATLQPEVAAAVGTLVLITGASYGGIHAPTPMAGAAAGPPTTVPFVAPPPLAPNNSQLPAFPGVHGSDPPPPGSGCS